MKLETTPLDYEQKEVDYKKFIESDLGPGQQVEERNWYLERLASDTNIKVKSNQ